MRVYLILTITFLLFSCSTPLERVTSPMEVTGYKYIEKARRDIRRSALESAIKNLDFALDIAQKNNLPYLKAYVYLERAAVASFLGSDYVEKELQFAEEIINKEAKDLTNHIKFNKAMLFYQKGRREEAKKLFNSIAKVPSVLKSHQLLFESIIAKDEHRDEDFKKQISKALKRTIKEEDYYLASYAYKLRASYYEEKGDFYSAIEDYQKSLNLERILNNKKEILKNLESLGELYSKVGDRSSAFYYYYQGWDLLSSSGEYESSQYFLNKALSFID